jgi:hypothetical protein
MPLLTVVNRYHEPFVGMFDGQEYSIADRATLPDYVARHLKNRSIVRDNPIQPSYNVYQLAIVEDGDSTDPIEDKPIETLDRVDMDQSKVRVVPTGIRQQGPVPRETTAARQEPTRRA